jgi:hypothetical protein
MLSTRSSWLRGSGRSSSTVVTINLALALGLVAIFLFSPQPAHAQYGPLSVGTWTKPVSSTTCTATSWFSYGTNYENCFTMTISCNNAQPLGLTFGYLSPAGIIQGPVNGTVVFFNGGDGTDPAGDATGTPSSELNMATQYFTQGYEVVQLAWNSPWEQTNNPGQTSPYPGNIQNAGCRPATFLYYVFQNIYNSVYAANNNAGMCAQGASAGSAQVAYSLAYYQAPAGQPWWVDNVELISGPVLSDIKQGCEEPPPPNVTVCGGNQYGCFLGPSNLTWSLSPTYLQGANTSVGKWTYDSTCTSSSGTSGASDAAWLAQSIVDQSSGGAGQGAVPTFSYSNTAMSAWLCRSLQDAVPNCNGGGYSLDACPNNSSPQGEIFYSQITQSNSHYAVYAVDSCGGPEGAAYTNSNVPGFSPPGSGFQSITADMAGSAALGVTAQCTHPAQHQ